MRLSRQLGAKPVNSRVLVVGSSARLLQLSDGRSVPTGNYLNETVVPMQALREAGYALVVATPDGMKPPLDQRSLAASHFGGDTSALHDALSFYKKDPVFRGVVTLRAVIDAGLDHIAGIFVPGGHAPITDLVASPEMGEILRHAHVHAKPTALLCHGPVAVLAAMPEAADFRQALIQDEKSRAAALARNWQYRGYRMTVFSNSEERSVETGVLGAPLSYPVADALSLAGGLVENGPDFAPFTIVDRELITGQNPRSDRAVAMLLVEALDARVHS